MKKVLIVDDALYMQLSLKEILERNGFQVLGCAENGLEAIKQYKILQPDIVTMDITMSVMDGVEALTEIKKLNPNVKIVMISALGQESKVRSAIMNGASGYIVKPFKEEYVVKVLGKL
jgi:two-component system, chemotaxis family, chemotaxis protein CheY